MWDQKIIDKLIGRIFPHETLICWILFTKKNLEGNGPKECRISILLNNSVNMRQYMIYTNEYSMNTDATRAIHILYEQIYILHVCSIILTFPQPLFFST